MVGTTIPHELHARSATVRHVENLSTTYRRLTLALVPGEAAVPWVPMAVGAHCKVVLPDPATGEVRFPAWGPGSGRPSGGSPLRDYTIRAVPEAGSVVIEAVLHGDGPGSAWAAGATEGTTAGILGPRGSKVMPADRPRYLCLVDGSALATAARLLEEAPAEAIVDVAVEGIDPTGILPDRAGANVTMVEDTDGTGLAAHLARMMPGPDDLVWGAGEASSMLRVRHAARALGVTSDDLVIHGYYKHGVSGRDHHAPLDA
ncbi:MAG: siderophore-interacting protein [Propioniciclava sp.]